ncbi:hypothetical protein QBC32DRAFT_122371 [Pseudoneurospora amorphoporcata]|uniref:Uncharacterized protein n=1 Tax=Pseudoneurospora amorphoporcata TaxID=241081 RepID=A0AAN6SBE5_9PEZI|nr:hypothetical protein QBC32DRAFT_122371 [Pseudoneurospora amorphoporcata]
MLSTVLRLNPAEKAYLDSLPRLVRWFLVFSFLMIFGFAFSVVGLVATRSYLHDKRVSETEGAAALFFFLIRFNQFCLAVSWIGGMAMMNIRARAQELAAARRR